MSLVEVQRYETKFDYRGWMALKFVGYGGTYEFTVGQGDRRLTVWGKSRKECERRAKRMIDDRT